MFYASTTGFVVNISTFKFSSAPINLHNIGVKARNRKHWKVITNSVVEAAYSDTATYDPTTGNSGDDELL